MLEESALNYNIVLQWRINRIASWMTLKSSERKTILPFLWIGFRVWLGWLVVFCLSSNFWTQFLHPIISEGNLRRLSRWFISFCIWFVQFPSRQPSGHNKLEACRKGWLRSIASDRTMILSFEHVWCRPNTTCFDVSSMLCCMYRARRGAFKLLPSGSLCSLSIRFTSRENTICLLLKFWPPVINPELMMECKLIAHPTRSMYLKKSSEIKSLSCNEGSTRLRPEWPSRARR